jgi:hypothetical protein
MRLAFLTLAVLVVIGALAWEFVPINFIVWDGSFDLAVNVSSTAGPFGSISCEACRDRKDTDFMLEHLPPPETVWSVVSNPFDGRPLTVHVPMGGKESPWGRELTRYQFRHLVVIGQLQDGRRLGKVVEIPDCRVSRQVSVSLP